MSLAESNKKLECYLSADARKARVILEDAGLDRDLALSVLEKLMTEDEMYEVPVE